MERRKNPGNCEIPHYEHSGNNLLDEIIKMEELNLAVIKTKYRKSSGMDNLNMELFKYGGYPLKETLLSLIFTLCSPCILTLIFSLFKKTENYWHYLMTHRKRTHSRRLGNRTGDKYS